MTTRSFLDGRDSAASAYSEAQKIAFAPVVFQAVRVARDSGLLKALDAAGKIGATVWELAQATDLSEYAIRVVCETALSAGVINMADERYVLTSVGSILLNDEITRVNFDFVNDVCYDALAHLEASLKEQRPAGLSVFGTWPTIYQALPSLPQKAQDAWFRFDHLYSDTAFPDALRVIAKTQPRRLLDIGGNTGKWALTCASALPEIEITLADLPGQLEMAKQNVAASAARSRIHFHPVDLLSETATLPSGFDAVWMSQFLVCFSEEQIVRILRQAADALVPGGTIFILDTFWDRQEQNVAAFCIINTSPYFTCLANGNSRMYTYADLERCMEKAGLCARKIHDDFGFGHSLAEVTLKTPRS